MPKYLVHIAHTNFYTIEVEVDADTDENGCLPAEEEWDEYGECGGDGPVEQEAWRKFSEEITELDAHDGSAEITLIELVKEPV
jgi:hypothetical protein